LFAELAGVLDFSAAAVAAVVEFIIEFIELGELDGVLEFNGVPEGWGVTGGAAKVLGTMLDAINANVKTTILNINFFVIGRSATMRRCFHLPTNEYSFAQMLGYSQEQLSEVKQ